MLKKLGRLGCPFLMLLMGWGFSANAQNAVKMIQAGNQETIFMLSAQPQVSIDGSSLVIETNNEKVTCNVAGGVNFEFVDSDSTAVEEIAAESSLFKISPEVVEGYNLAPDSQVMIFDIAGKCLKSVYTDPKGFVSINVADLPSGVYVFNSKDKNFKFYKK